MSTEDEMEDVNQNSATQVTEPPARDADADAMNDQEGHNEMESNSQDHATQVYESSLQDTSDEEMDVDSSDDVMNFWRGLDDTVLHHSIEISTEYPEHLFIDVEDQRSWS